MKFRIRKYILLLLFSLLEIGQINGQVNVTPYDTNICIGNSILLTCNYTNVSYQWQDSINGIWNDLLLNINITEVNNDSLIINNLSNNLFLRCKIDTNFDSNFDLYSRTSTIFVNPLPISAGTISGLSTVCQGQNSVIYTVPLIANATSYIWSLPSGVSGTSNTNTITVNYTTTAASGNITVKGNNSCGVGVAASQLITVNPLPLDAGTISGLSTVCQGQNSVIYTVPLIANTTSYIWSLPSGVSGTSSTNTITVNYATSAVSGYITVKGNNSCGDGVSISKAITINPLPIASGAISGLTTVCQGQNGLTYSVPSITNATSYNWILPMGATGTSTTNSITLNYTTTSSSGNIEVKGNNACGFGVSSNIAITVNPIIVGGNLTGSVSQICLGDSIGSIVLNGSNGQIYSLQKRLNGGTWFDNFIAFPNFPSNDIPTSSGIWEYRIGSTGYCNSAYSNAYSVIVNTIPNSGNLISLSDTIICKGQTSQLLLNNYTGNITKWQYSISPYNVWTDIATSNSNYITNLNQSTKVRVVVSNPGCNSVISNSIGYNINQLPIINAGNDTLICPGSNLQLNATSGLTNYKWDPIIAINNSNISNPIVNPINNTTYLLSATNQYGCKNYDTINISIKPLPGSAGIITGNQSVCQGVNNVKFKITPVNNASNYLWTLPQGVIGNSLSDSIIVNITDTALSGNIIVKGQNSCGYGNSTVQYLNVNPLPYTAGSIVGSTTVCKEQNNINYSLAGIPNAISYIWTLPNGVIGSSSSNLISVNFGSLASTGNIIVKGHNACGDGIASSKTITVQPALIINAGSDSSICFGDSIKINAVGSGITTYAWLPPIGISNSNVSNPILYPSSTTNYVLNVSNQYECQASDTIKISIKPLPEPAGLISGINNLCQGQTNIIYKIPPINFATSYIWTLPTGSTGVSSSDSIIINYNNTAMPGNIMVRGVNGCGEGSASIKSIYINPIPKPHITGNEIPCRNEYWVKYYIQQTTDTIKWKVINGNIWNNQWSTSQYTGVGENEIFVHWDTLTIGKVIAEQKSDFGCRSADTLIIIKNDYIAPDTLKIIAKNNDLNTNIFICPDKYNYYLWGYETKQDFIETTKCSNLNWCLYDFIDTINNYYWVKAGNSLECLTKSYFNPIKLFKNTKIDETLEVKVYPNPFIDNINIDIDNVKNENAAIITIYSILGIKVFEDNLINQNIKKIDLSTFNSGIYILKIERNQHIITKKIIKGNINF